MERDFCRGWFFSKKDGRERIVDLPHDAMLEEARTFRCHNGERTGYFPGGKYVYRKEFDLSEEETAGYIALRFGGVYRHAAVWLNGEKLTEQNCGYLEFEVELTPHAKAGRNEVVVTVDNSLEPNSRWYTGSGIYRPVTLVTKPARQIRELWVRTISAFPAAIEVICDAPQAHIEILEDGKIIAEGAPGRLEVPGAKLWSAETPHLYTCRATVGRDVSQVTFGIRKATFSPETGFCVNGKRVLLRGGCIHHDNGILGACAFKDAEERKIRILKECGYNAVRSSHNPCSTELLDACDRLGMYVLDEAFDGWYTPKTHHDSARTFIKDWENILTVMGTRDRTHPSVIAYSIGNEVTEVGQPEGVSQAKAMVELLHQTDPTRPVTCGVNAMLTVWGKMGLGVYKDKEPYVPITLPPENASAPKSGSALFNALSMRLGSLMSAQTAGKQADQALAGISEELDILGLNYGQCRYDKELRQHPGRMLLGTETYISDLPYNWQRVKENPALLGDFCWTAMDYIGEAGIGYWQYPSEKVLPLLAGCGSVDILGCPDVTNGFQRIVWGLRTEPLLAVRPLDHGKEKPLKKAWRFTNAVSCWTWPGQEGKPAVVEVYSASHSVELRLNGKPVSRQLVKRFQTVFHVPYIPGTLEAVALDASGKVISRSILHTGDTPELTLQAEKSVLRANGQDLCYLMIELADRQGIVTPIDSVAVHVDVTGPAILQALGSARRITDETYRSNTHTTYQGRCLAILRAGYESGEAVVSVSADGFKAQQIKLRIESTAD